MQKSTMQSAQPSNNNHNVMQANIESILSQWYPIAFRS